MIREARSTPRRIVRFAIGGMAFVLASTGCASMVNLEPAEDANNPECARVIADLPAHVGGEPRRWMDAQSTGAWGDPTAVILTCGVPAPGRSDLPCFYLGGTDWLAFPQEEELQRVVTFGRDPAYEVVIARSGDLDFASVLEEIGRLIDDRQDAATGVCSERTRVP